MYRLQEGTRLIRTDRNLKSLLEWALKNGYHEMTIHEEVRDTFDYTFLAGIPVSELDYMYRETGMLLL